MEPVRRSDAGGRRWATLYSSPPLSFEPNLGQTDRQVKFLTRGPGYALFLTSSQAVLALHQPASMPGSSNSTLRFKLVGANRQVGLSGLDPLPGQSNYFLGNDSRLWRTQIPTYTKVRYHNLYDGVDLVYYGRRGDLEYDYVVAPGAEVERIHLRVEGATGMEVEATGDLVLRVGGGEVRFHRPQAYQSSGGRKQWIAARYALRGRQTIGFKVGAYDRHQPLIVDPVLSYSTYLGGTGGDVGYGIAVDSSGNAYVAGLTNSTNFPTLSGEQGSSGGNGDAFVTKLNSTGTALLYSTYLGGSGADGADTATGIAVDASGDAFLTGSTTSPNFPTTTGAFQTVYGGNGDAFVAELNSTGNKLVYSSYLGGHGADAGQAIAVDSSGDAYVTGSTESSDFPTVSPLQSLNAGASDAFACKVNFSGSALVYSTYLGGTQAEVGQGIQVDSSGNAYIVGYTFSSDFPTLNPLQSSNAGQADAFVAGLNSEGSALTFSTYLGGSANDRGFGIALDASGSIYVTGMSQSADFRTTSGAFQASNKGQGDAFVAKLSSGGSALTYSTLLGGSNVDQGNAVAVDSSGNVFVTGFTQSSDFPTADPVQTVLGLSGGGSCGSSPCADAFVTQLSPSGRALIYSTYLGGSSADFGQGVALDSTGDPYITGSTPSTNFPAVAGAYQGSLAGVAGNAFVAKVDSSDAPQIAIVPAKLNFGNQPLSVRSAAQTITIIDPGSQPLLITSITSSNADFAETDDCVGSVSSGGGTCNLNVTFTPSTAAAETDTITIDDNASGSPHTITVTGTGVTAATDVTVSPASLSFANQTVGTVSSPQTTTITNTGTTTLTITSIAVTGDFLQTNTCGAKLNILNVGESCSVTVSFTPTATGGRTGTLSIADNASGSPQGVALSGTGLAVFSLTSTSSSTSVVIGSTTASFTVSVPPAGSFTGSITLSCAVGATCSFNPASIFAGQSSTLTVSSLTASTANPFNFTVNGTSGSQTATLSLNILLADFALSATPALNTITSGSAAGYTVVVTPSNGFNQQVQLSCTNPPVGTICSFASSALTPNGSPVTTALTVQTTISTVQGERWKPLGGAPPPLLLLLAGAGVVWGFTHLRRRVGPRPTARPCPQTLCLKVVTLVLLAILAASLGSCRSTSSNAGPTNTGNYTITISGTLSSNTSVVRTTTVNLSVT